MGYRFRDLVDVEALGGMLESLYTAAGIPSAVIDMEGTVLAGAGWQRICTDFHRRNPESLADCLQSDTHISEQVAGGAPYVIYRCPRGLVDSSCPVMIEGQHVANVFTGQLFHTPPDAETWEWFREQAQLFGFDEAAYLEAVAEVPVFPPVQHRAILAFLSKLAIQIATIGLARQREMQQAEQLRASEARLQHAEKMEAVGQLAGGVAHDFNNQLVGILGYAELLAQQATDPTQRRFSDAIVRAARRSSELTGQLLAFARKDVILNRELDLHDVIREVVELLQRSLDKRIALDLQLEARPSTVVGDPNRLQNAILNLALNARDAMPEGGRLAFVTCLAELDESAESLGLEPGPHLELQVCDTGSGMDSETRSHLFEPFFTTKQSGAGTGLGLAAVYGTVKSHRGAIAVRSVPGAGSTFTVYLPLVAATVAPPERQDDHPVQGTGRIMVVDDEDLVRSTLYDSLHSLGYDVLTCISGDEALETYRRQWRHIDLVILDMVMPGTDSHDVYLTLREVNPAIRALLCSGYGVNERVQSILAQGVRGFVQKPFDRESLSRAVTAALRA